MLISLRHGRLGRRRWCCGCGAAAGEERQQLRLIALVRGAGRGRPADPASSVQAVNGGQQTWLSGVPLVRRLLPDADPVRGRGAALPALRPRRDHQPDRGRGRRRRRSPRSATPRWSWSPGARWRAGPAASGCRCSRRRWSRSRSSRCAAVVVRLANRLAYGDRAQPYEALADFSRRLAEAPDPGRPCSRRSPRRPARAVSAAGRAATLDVPGSEPVVRDLGLVGRRRRRRPVRRGPGPHRGTRARAASRWRSRAAAACDPPTSGCSRRSPTRPPSPSATPRSPAPLADRVAELDRTTRAARRVAAAADRGRRRRPARAGGGDRPGGAAVPAVAAGRDRARPARRWPRGADADLDRLVDGTNAGAGVAARAHPRRLPHPAGPVRARAGAAVAPRPLGGWRAALTVDGGRRAAVLAPGRGGGLLLLRRGRPRRGPGRRRSTWPPPATTWCCGSSASRRRVDLQAITDRVEAVGGHAERWRRAAGADHPGRGRRPDRTQPWPAIRAAASQAAESRSGPNAALAM